MSTTFAYTARDPLGNLHEGRVDAVTPDEATQSLRRDGFEVVELAEEADGGGLALFARGVSQTDIIYVTNQLAIMADTGITISAALAGICQQEENPTLKKMLLAIKGRVEAGEDFSTALAQYPDQFDSTYLAMVRASERTGDLGKMLERIGNYLRGEIETRGKVVAALAYPGIMLALAVGVTIFLLTFVLPKFEPLFTRKGVELPLPTIVMMAASNALIHYWYLWIAGVAAAGIGLYFGAKTDAGRQAIDWLKINLPILGPMFRKVAISRSIRTLGTMIASGVPMLDAIKLAAEISGNYYYEQVWQEVLDKVTTGSTIVDALKNNSIFPATLVQMIGAGEETGKLDFVLEKVSSYYDQEVELSLKTTTALIEPIMITVMGVVVGGIGMALMLPIFKLSSTPG